MINYTQFEDNEQQDAVEAIGFRRNVDIDTDLIKISFLSPRINDNEVNITNHLLVRNIYNVLADNLVRAIASNAVQIHSTLCDHETIADGTATKIATMFEASFELKEEYVNRCTPAQKARMEAMFAEIFVFRSALKELDNSFVANFPRAVTGLQYAYVGALGERNTGVKQGPLHDFKQAFDYRYSSDNRFLAIKKIVEKRRNGDKEIEALNKGDVNGLISF